jgi:outer membrane protein assembly factor BamE (lipoprotein component of BamABCDE complex)
MPFAASKSRRIFLMFGVSIAVSACTPEINRRGYYVKPGAFQQVREGMPKAELEALLGSPSTTASVNFQGDSYYYITSTTVSQSFLTPKEINRQVIAIRFSKEDRVESFAQYGLEDGRIINLNERSTPVPGSEFSLLKELFSSGTRVGPGGNLLNRTSKSQGSRGGGL